MRGIDPRPSRESRREVRKEFKARQKRHRQLQREWQQLGQGAGGRGGRSIAPGAVAGAVVLAVVVAAGYLLLRTPAEATSTATPPLATPTAPATTPTTTASRAPTAPADPFADSPVAAWFSGAAALVPPAAAPVGTFTTAQVSDAYTKAQAYLSAAFLDPAVVYGGSVEPIAAVLEPTSVSRLRSMVAAPGTGDHDPLYFASRFTGDEVAAAVPDIRVNGSMAAKQSPDASTDLQVTFDYAFVYAVRPAAGGPTLLVSVRRVGTLEFRSASRSAGTTSKAHLRGGTYLNTGAACHRGPQHVGFLDVWFDRATDGEESAAPPVRFNPLDLTAPLPGGSDCYLNTSGL